MVLLVLVRSDVVEYLYTVGDSVALRHPLFFFSPCLFLSARQYFNAPLEDFLLSDVIP